MPTVWVAGTCDTKHAELAYVRQLLRDAGLTPRLVDLGTRSADAPPDVDVPASTVASHHPDGPGAIHDTDDRGTAVTAMAVAFERFLLARSADEPIAGIIALGGGGGTALATRAMRALPIGVPKVMVSTMASGDVAPYVGESDLVMVPSVTDVSGLNRISRVVLGNAAGALAGMVKSGSPRPAADGKPAIALTMFGVTTTCVDAVRASLEADHDCLVFHATGTGGRTMEKLVDSGLASGVIDVTTTEVCDHLLGGVLSAGRTASGRSRGPGFPTSVPVAPSTW